MEVLELKNSKIEIKRILDGLNGKMEMTEGRDSEIEPTSVEIT